MSRRSRLPRFISRRGFLALTASVLLPQRTLDISHFPPTGMFRGNPLRTGFYDAADVPTHATLEEFYRGGHKIVASPLIADDLVCVGHCTARNLALTSRRPHPFVALDLRTGRPRWTFLADSDIVSSAARYGDTLLVGSLDGRLNALDLDGTRKWTFQAEGGIFGSPAVDDGYAVFASGDMGLGRLYCLDIRRRRLRWPPVEMPAGPFASPCIAAGNIFVGTYWDTKKDSHLYVVDLHSGQRRRVATMHMACYCATPASDGQTVYIADCGEWARKSIFYAFDAATAEELWRLELDADNVASSPSLVGHLAIFGCDRGTLMAVNTAERRLEWRTACQARAFHASPIATPGAIYIGSTRGNLHVFDHAGQLLRQYRAGSEIESTAAIRDGQLFFGTAGGRLFRLAAPATQPRSPGPTLRESS